MCGVACDRIKQLLYVYIALVRQEVVGLRWQRRQEEKNAEYSKHYKTFSECNVYLHVHIFSIHFSFSRCVVFLLCFGLFHFTAP